MDIVNDLAQPLAGIITLRLLGVDENSCHDYAAPVRNETFGNGTEAEMVAGIIAFTRQVAGDVCDPAICQTGGMIQKLHEYKSRGFHAPSTSISTVSTTGL